MFQLFQPKKKLGDLNIPKHLAIIMDGNRRWASRRGLPSTYGHKSGAKQLENITLFCKKLGVKILTVFAFSSSNWKRERSEVSDIMDLFNFYLSDKRDVFMENDIRVTFIGDSSVFNEAMQASMRELEDMTSRNGFKLVVALNYSGRRDILDTVLRLHSAGLLNDDLDADVFSRFTMTSDLPDPDLLIRTGGEFRVSDFLLWQISFTELYFTDVQWPEFDEKCLLSAVEEYSKRERRYGS